MPIVQARHLFIIFARYFQIQGDAGCDIAWLVTRCAAVGKSHRCWRWGKDILKRVSEFKAWLHLLKCSRSRITPGEVDYFFKNRHHNCWSTAWTISSSTHRLGIQWIAIGALPLPVWSPGWLARRMLALYRPRESRRMRSNSSLPSLSRNAAAAEKLQRRPTMSSTRLTCLEQQSRLLAMLILASVLASVLVMLIRASQQANRSMSQVPLIEEYHYPVWRIMCFLHLTTGSRAGPLEALPCCLPNSYRKVRRQARLTLK